MLNKEKLLLLFILLFGFLIRIFEITNFPPSLNWDEVSHGYNAYSILKTGRDEWGKLFPLDNFRAYGDYPLPLNLYVTIPSIVFLGLNEFGIRFPHAILGTAIILSTYFLVRGLRFNEAIALLAGLFVAIDPWTFFPSRAVFQSNVASFFFITGIVFFLYRKRCSFFLPLSAVFVGLSLYAYHNTRIFVPLLLAIAAFIWFKTIRFWLSKRKVVTIPPLLILLAFILPIPFIVMSPEGRARSNWVFIVDEGSISRIEQMRQASNLPEAVERLAYNRYSYFVSEFAKNYIGYFSHNFLFLSGGSNYQFSVPDKGVLYLVNLPFFYIGLLVVAFVALKKRKKEELFLLLWLVLGLIPAGITQGQFHVIRATTIIPLPQILVALGLATFWLWIRGKHLRLLFGIIYAVILSYFVESYATVYFGSYRTNYSWSWQYGYKDAVGFIKDNYNNYDRIIMTKKYGEPHEFVLFYMEWDPEKYRNDPNLIRFGQSNWYWVDRFDKFYFVNDWQVPRDVNGVWKLESGGVVPTNGRTLLITSPGNYPPEFKLLETINFLDRKPAFEVLEKI